MSLTHREIWTALHGLVFGSAFLLLFSGGIIALWGLHADHHTEAGLRHRLRILRVGSWTLAILAWLTVIIGTYTVYPWYRAKAPPGLDDRGLRDYPRSLLKAHEQTAEWHEFGMEWKEHIAWLVPLLVTGMAFVITFHGQMIVRHSLLRNALMMMLVMAFFCAAVAGGLGAFINKAAPVR